MSYIRLNKLSLDYILPVKRQSIKHVVVKSLAGFLGRRAASQSEISKTYNAIDHLDLSIEHGDRIGLIGRNGAGKSSLLKVMANIYTPTMGCIDTEGHISSLLSMDVGLNSNATGYENIILLGMLRGKKKHEMVSLFKEIEAITELGNFLKIPVKTYS